MVKRFVGPLVVCTVVLCSSFTAVAQETFAIRFDGAEAGIEEGSTDFSFEGANWTGGIVDTQGDFPLYSSGLFSYNVDPGPASVTFDSPMETVLFFFVHGLGVNEGTATATRNDVEVDSAVSNIATQFNDQNNFVTLTSETGIDRIDFAGGVIDNFFFTELLNPPPPPPPPPAPSTAVVVEGNPFAEEGGDITLSANEDMDPPYQWIKDGADIGGETNASFGIMGTALSDSGVYMLQYDDGEKATALSDPVELAIFPSGALPVAGMIGLSLMALTCVFGGATILHRHKK